jgi:predicted permease
MKLDSDDQRIHPQFVTWNYFSELGAQAQVGRLFVPSMELSSRASPVAVLSFRCWQANFEGDRALVGKTIRLDGRAVTVIGVTSQKFANLGADEPDVWLPLTQHSYFVQGSKPLTDSNFDGMIIMWGRLARGATVTQAEQELLSLTNQLRKVYPALIWDREYILVTPGAHFFPVEDSAPALAIATPLVLLILAVACANLGGLLTARGVKRRHEIRLRFDLGAGRLRVLRQLLTESALLGVVGSAAALPLSYAVLKYALLRANAPDWMSAVPDWRVIIFTGTMGVVAALFFGLLPAARLIRKKPGGTRWMQFIVCAQVSASCILFILAGLLVRATLHTLYSDPGFKYEQVLSVEPRLEDHGFTSAAAQTYLDQLQSRMRGVPGVVSVSLALNPPLVNEEVMITGIDIGGHRVLIYPNWVGPAFFQTMGIPLLQGRYFGVGETHAVILSQSLAHKRWPNESAIGKFWKSSDDVVIGVVGNTRAMELNNTDATEIYYPPNSDLLPGMSVLIKTAGDPQSASQAIKEISKSVNPKLLPTIIPLKAGFQKNASRAEQITSIVSLLGTIAIFLAITGLLGLVAYTISHRTKEIAIRFALGATRTDIASSVLRQFTWPVLAGLVLGIILTAALSQVLQRVLYGISGLDPISYVGAVFLLAGVLIVAGLVPIRRTFTLNVAATLRWE